MKFFKYIFLFLFLFFVNCARTGAPTGGDEDKIPPKLLMANPPLQSIDFKGNKIRLYFDEYVTLKDVRKQLIISPPLNSFPEITPTTASKYIDIKISDTLLANTTYSLNFGNAIQDYNEGNALPFFKYVFSTGKIIDTLKVRGKISDAFRPKVDNFVNVMLYEITDKIPDSLVFKKKPTYVTNTLDSLETFEITNVKKGKYLLVAMKDKANNFVFDPKQDKIAFRKTIISVPTDTSYSLSLFKEIPANKTLRPFQSAEKRVTIGYEGKVDKLKIEVFNPPKKDFKYLVTKDLQKDSLHLWLSSKIDDSLKLIVRNSKIDTFKVHFRKMKPDSLQITTQNKSISPTEESVVFQSNIPIEKFNSEKIKITESDSIPVKFSSEYDVNKQKFIMKFSSKSEGKYQLKALPETFVDFYGKTNDTLSVNILAKSASDFASFKLTIAKKHSYPLLIELTNEKGDVSDYQQFIEKDVSEVLFPFVKAGKYLVRIIEDKNANKKWDTGSILEFIEPEKVYYLPKEVDLRPNWEIQETFDNE